MLASLKMAGSPDVVNPWDWIFSVARSSTIKELGSTVNAGPGEIVYMAKGQLITIRSAKVIYLRGRQ
jgi:hypothetical protein